MVYATDATPRLTDIEPTATNVTQSFVVSTAATKALTAVVLFFVAWMTAVDAEKNMSRKIPLAAID
jgi:hypothetical protein